MSTTQETIDGLRKLDRSTVPAPWSTTYSCGLESIEGIGAVIKDAEGETVAEADAYFEHHSFFIDDALPLMVELRNALPVLLTEIDRLNNHLSIANARLGRVAASYPEAYEAALEGARK